MKRFLPLLAMSAMFIAAPAFAQDAASEQQFVAQAPSSSVVVGAPTRERINLSDAQLEQLRAIREASFQATVTKKADLAVLKSKLRAAMTAENVDRNAVMALQSQVNAITADISNTKIASMLDARNVFTPEQRRLMHSRMLHHGMGGFGGHHGGWGHGKGGSCGGGHGHGGHGGPGGHGFGGHRGFGGPGGPGGHGGPGGPGPGAHAMEDGPAPDMTADAPDAPDFDGMTAQIPPMDGPDFDGE
jgi:Spy/CpxP family protein refolding chaperone